MKWNNCYDSWKLYSCSYMKFLPYTYNISVLFVGICSQASFIVFSRTFFGVELSFFRRVQRTYFGQIVFFFKFLNGSKENTDNLLFVKKKLMETNIWVCFKRIYTKLVPYKLSLTYHFSRCIYVPLCICS